jgi:hypothetical protein
MRAPDLNQSCQNPMTSAFNDYHGVHYEPDEFLEILTKKYTNDLS